MLEILIFITSLNLFFSFLTINKLYRAAYVVTRDAPKMRAYDKNAHDLCMRAYRLYLMPNTSDKIMADEDFKRRICDYASKSQAASAKIN